MSPPLIFPGWFCDGIEVHPVWKSLLVGADCQSWSLICIVLYSELVGRDMSTHSMWEKYGYHIKLVTFFKLLHKLFRCLGNFIRLFTFFKLFVSIFWSLGNFIRLLTLVLVRLVTLFIISVFWSLGNFIRLVTLFIISLNCSQFMWESLGMATFSCFLLQVHGKFHEYGGKGLQLDQWALPFCSHWLTTSPPLIFPEWFGNGTSN